MKAKLFALCIGLVFSTNLIASDWSEMGRPAVEVKVIANDLSTVSEFFHLAEALEDDDLEHEAKESRCKFIQVTGLLSLQGRLNSKEIESVLTDYIDQCDPGFTDKDYSVYVRDMKTAVTPIINPMIEKLNSIRFKPLE